MTSSTTIDERYFAWLFQSVNHTISKDPKKSYWRLCEQLYKKPFEWFIANDDNRAEDGRLLRESYLDTENDYADQDWLDLDCSMFELLIAVAHRASFETDVLSDVWFWQLITNLELSYFNDYEYSKNKNSQLEIDKILNHVNKRTYSSDGHGGLFPLRAPKEDQRKVEIWYQMSSYLFENELSF